MCNLVLALFVDIPISQTSHLLVTLMNDLLNFHACLAIIVMIDIASYEGIDAVKIGDISKRIGVSASYLQKILTELRKSGLVISVPGPSGGIRTIKSPSEITIASIAECFSITKLGGYHLTDNAWQKYREDLENYLCTITLDRYIDKQ